MLRQCAGTTKKGKQCKLHIKGSSYCNFHQSQGQHIPECGDHHLAPRRVAGGDHHPAPPIEEYAPLNQTPLHNSPQIIYLTNEQEGIGEGEILEEDNPYDDIFQDNDYDHLELETLQELSSQRGLEINPEFSRQQYIDELVFLDNLLNVQRNDYSTSTYDDLYNFAETLGFNAIYLPPKYPFEEDLDDSHQTLVSLIDDYMAGQLDDIFLRDDSILKYNYSIQRRENYHDEIEGFEGSKPGFIEEENIPSRQEPQLVEHDCCICLDEKIREEALLECNHPVCVPCLRQLTKAECPMCRTALAGPNITAEIFNDILQREEGIILAQENANLLVAQALDEDPDQDPTELYDRFYQAI